MPFTNTSSLTSSDANNLVRGLHKDNTTYSTSGTGEDDLASYTMTGGTMGATGAIIIFATGTITGTNGQKDVDLYFGGSVIATIVRSAATTNDWTYICKISNTSASAQRIEVWKSTDSAATMSFDYTTAAIATASNAIIKVTGECANAADTVSQTKFEIFVVQIA